MNIRNFKNSRAFIAENISLILLATKNKKAPTIALSGGTTPIETYETLSKTPLAKNAIFFQADERYIPKNRKESNQKMISETIKPAHFLPFNTSLPIEDSIKKYAETLPTSLDLTILGIGPDGHIASIFPNTPNKKAKEKTAHTQTNEFDIKDRLTLTIQTILKSKTILVLLKNKSEVLTQIKKPTLNKDDFPALHILKHPNLHVHNLQN